MSTIIQLSLAKEENIPLAPWVNFKRDEAAGAISISYYIKK